MSDRSDVLEPVRRTMEAALGALILVAADGTIRLANRACEQLFGVSGGGLDGQSIESLVPDKLRSKHFEHRLAYLRAARQRPMAEGLDARARHQDGHEFRVRIDLHPFPTAQSDFVLCSVVDLAPAVSDQAQILQLRQELEAVRSELRVSATTDGLTGLRNRRGLMEQLGLEIERALRAKRAVSLVLLDLDRFKRYNDRFGHGAGDTALRQVAQVLRIQGRASDVLGRYAGKAFCVIMPETDRAGALVAAGRLHQAIGQEHFAYRSITASIGVASFAPESGADRTVAKNATRLLADADEALSRAKQAGRNRVIHAAELEPA